MNIWASRFSFLNEGIRKAIRGEKPLSYPLKIVTDFASRQCAAFYVRRKYRKNDCWDFGGFKLPLMQSDYEKQFADHIYFETIAPYLKAGRVFTEEMHGGGERVYYGLKNDAVNVIAEPGDIVMDIGSWAGDFAAVASHIGAVVYAFEPAPKTFDYLCRTAELNGSITPVNMGLGDERGVLPLHVSEDNSIASTFEDGRLDAVSSRVVEVPITTLDDFVEKNNIGRVDFIKSDIEGFERHMLAGARNVLRNFAPKLAICTYHLPDDPQVLERIILEANPDYRIVHMPQILFADAR